MGDPSMTKPKAGEPSDEELERWWQGVQKVGLAPMNQSVITLAFARRVWCECRERTLEEAQRVEPPIGTVPKGLSELTYSVGWAAIDAYRRATTARKENK